LSTDQSIDRCIWFTGAAEVRTGTMVIDHDICLAGTVNPLRHTKALGRAPRAISVIKKPTRAHETTIRARFGAPPAEFQSMPRGIPTHNGTTGSLVTSGDYS
jgi:hypothetical protein